MSNLSVVEKIKTESKGLRGTLVESLNPELTGSLLEADQTLIKFHGVYQQDDRDRREERAEKKLENLYSFMIRLRLSGGLMNSKQWLATHHIAGEHSTGTIKITTRQTVQLHGIVKSHLRPTIKAFDEAALDSIAACGDVNRNVVCSAHPMYSPLHREIHDYADRISLALLPKTKAYYEIWLEEEKLAEKEIADPLYQDRYLPRKFKIAIAIPPQNDVDVFANDIGLIAIIENGELKGFNISVGGGLAMTHGNEATYPRLGTILGFVEAGEKTMKMVYEIVTVQRDFGNRTDRKLSRLKYTVDKMGVEGFKTELEKRLGFELEPARKYELSKRADDYGWHKNHEGKWFYTVFVENGLIKDLEEAPIKTALFEIAKTEKAWFRFTCNQNVMLADIAEQDKAEIEAILKKYNLAEHTEKASPIRKNAVACVAFNTCPLALAEAQRYLPTLIGKIEPLLEKYNLKQEGIHIRMTGCPNGCGRPYLAEIGLIGTAYGHYNLHLGGDPVGLRLNKTFKQNLNEDQILDTLGRLFAIFVEERNTNETFGDFVQKKFAELRFRV